MKIGITAESAINQEVRDLVGRCGGWSCPIILTVKRIEKTLVRVLFENVKNPFVRSFLRDNLSEFVTDFHAYFSDIFANLSSERKPFIKSAGLAFLSAPIVGLAPELPWHRMRVAIETAVHETLSAAGGYHGGSNGDETRDGGDTSDLIERAIAAAFVSVCESADGHTGAVLIGGLADLLGKYIALYVAGTLDEAQFRLIMQAKSAKAVSTEPSEKSDRPANYYSPCNAQPYVEEC